MPLLRPGQLLRCVESQAPCQVDSLLGDGGQGEVQKVWVDGQAYALKWYNDLVLRVDTTLRRRLQVAIDHGAPSSSFLWPFELVTLPDGSRLGYLMRLRTPHFVKAHEVLSRQALPRFRALATIGWQLTEALLALHAKGLIYQDLNAGNVFLDPASGRIELCDNDNVDIDGAPSVMGGVWEFQAPEVVLRLAGPSRATDLYSLAVMLFRLLHLGHPLVGACELRHPNLTSPSVLRRIYGSEARFVFDPADASNRPLPERHGPVLGHWAIYPEALRRLFVRAFTVGLHDPLHGRVQETEWRHAMRQLLDAVYPCPHCGAENFYDPQRLAEGRRHVACWGCGAALPAAPTRIGLRRRGAAGTEPPRHVVVLAEGTQLFPHHLASAVASGGPGDAQPQAACEVEAEPALRNLGAQPWQAWPAGDTAGRAIPPGASVPLSRGLRIDFGSVVGEVKMPPAGG